MGQQEGLQAGPQAGPHFGSHGGGGFGFPSAMVTSRAAKSAASSSRTRWAPGLARISARAVSITFPTGSQRENTHGHTEPSGDTAITPETQ